MSISFTRWSQCQYNDRCTWNHKLSSSTWFNWIRRYSFGEFVLYGTTQHCILVSTLFWTLMAITLAVLMLLIVGLLKIFPKKAIDEGEFWVGGLISFSLFVLIIFSHFSSVMNIFCTLSNRRSWQSKISLWRRSS